METLSGAGESYFLQSSWAFRRRIDSLLSACGDSLDTPRKNAVLLYGLEKEHSMSAIGAPARKSLSSLFQQFERTLRRLEKQVGSCDTCETRSDLENRIALYGGQGDSLSGFYGDSMATIVEGWESSIDDTNAAFAESVNDSIQALKGEYADYLKEHASRLDIEAGYESHSSYRGRDNGVSEGSIGPTVTYHHKSGLFVGGALGWVSQSLASPDVSSVSAGYEFAASSMIAGSVTYTHFWYSASSLLPQAVTDQEVSGILTLSTDFLSAAGSLLDDFTARGGSEISIGLDLSRSIPVSEHVFGGSLSLEPTATAMWGEQSERLLQKRIQRAKKKEIVRVSGSPYDVFSIMAYELALPVDLEIGNLAIVPYIEWTLPVDVLNQKTVLVKDPSSSNAFLSAGLTVSMTFY